MQSVCFLKPGLWPGNVVLLQTRGIKFEWRQADHDLRLSCPLCAGVLMLHEAHSWHHCADIGCLAYRMAFNAITSMVTSAGQARE